jgi:hypothetical protein
MHLLAYISADFAAETIVSLLCHEMDARLGFVMMRGARRLLGVMVRPPCRPSTRRAGMEALGALASNDGLWRVLHLLPDDDPNPHPSPRFAGPSDAPVDDGGNVGERSVDGDGDDAAAGEGDSATGEDDTVAVARTCGGGEPSGQVLASTVVLVVQRAGIEYDRMRQVEAKAAAWVEVETAKARRRLLSICVLKFRI